MQERLQKIIALLHGSRALWIIGAVALMFGSAYSAMRLMAIAAAESGWIGLPQHAAQIPGLETQAKLWQTFAVALPFLAAALLAFGKTSTTDPGAWASPVLRYLVRLVISFLGALGFVLLLSVIGFFLAKLGIHAG